MDNPGKEHWQQLINTLAYIRDHPNASIVCSNTNHMTYNHHGYTYHMKSNHVYCFVNADLLHLIPTIGIPHPVISFFSTVTPYRGHLKTNPCRWFANEADYITLYEASKEVIWLKMILGELGFDSLNAALIFEDNSSTICAAYNPVEHSKLKHLDINFHVVRQFIELNKVAVIPIFRTNQIADILTKPLHSNQFDLLRAPLVTIP